jgi:hypothetical protein
MTDPRPTLEERLRAAYKPLDVWMPNSLLCEAADELARLRAQVITGVYDAASVGITLIDTGKLDRLRAQVEALREALLDLFYASGDVSVSGQKDSVNAFLEARKQALASAGSGKK